MNIIAIQNRLKTYNLYNNVNQHQLNGIFKILEANENDFKIDDKRQLAYILATVYWETGRTFEPIEELGKGLRYPYGGKIKMNRKPYTTPDKIYYGRGLVQLTWYENYEKFGKLLGLDLLNEPELLLTYDVSIKVLFLGMKNGLFTGHKLGEFFDYKKEDYVGARRIINGKDKAELIAIYAKSFYKAIL
jgi:predicted chitinase